jgi:hypothetical protein
MLPPDEEEFISRACEDGDVVLVKESSDQRDAVILERLPPQGTLEARRGLVLWNRAITPRIVVDPLRPNLFGVNKTNSEVIELSQSEMKDGVLEHGRLWIETHANDEQFNPVPKSEAFIKWYDGIARWIRKHYAKGPYGRYVATHAQRWVESGGILR